MSDLEGWSKVIEEAAEQTRRTSRLFRPLPECPQCDYRETDPQPLALIVDSDNCEWDCPQCNTTLLVRINVPEPTYSTWVALEVNE
jgi:hypothetical protein